MNLWVYFITSDIDQLTRILVLCGTPSEETLNKITSEEVSAAAIYTHIYIYI